MGTIDPALYPYLLAAAGFLVATLIMLVPLLRARYTTREMAGQLQSEQLERARLDAEHINTKAQLEQLSQTNREQLTAISQLTAEKQATLARLEETQNANGLVTSDLKAQQSKSEQLQAEIAQLEQSRVRLEAELAAREENIRDQLALFEQQKQDFSQRFQLLAQEILDKKTQTLQQNNQESLNKVINPFQVSLNEFKEQVNTIHRSELSQRAELKKELVQLKELNNQLSVEAHELSTALRGQKKLQGNWGELVLENLLERSGLQAGKDYRREVSFTTDHGRQRPDAIVFLPQNKHLIIDAKVSLNAYTRYVNSEAELERTAALNDHVRAVKDRINELATRAYDDIDELNSPEVVFMFVPVESAFVEALKADESLFQTALEQNILVATPTTLLTSLNIVRQLWRFEQQGKHTAALADKADKVFQKLNGFLKSFDQIKKSLDKASESYQKAENQLLSGRGNLVKQVSEFKQLAPAIKAELPQHFEEKASLEVDFASNEGQEKLEETIKPANED